MQFADFVSCALGSPRHRRGEAALARGDAGADRRCVCRPAAASRGGPFHSQNPESSFAHIPGLKCVCPSTPEDAKGLLVSAIEDPNPVLFFEHKHLYRRIKGEVPDERYTVPIGEGPHPPGGRGRHRRHLGRDGAHGRRRPPSSSRRRLGRDHRSAHDRPVGQGGGARVGAQDLEGARPARGHAHRRLRRRDRGDDRRGGVRGPRRTRRSGSPRPTRPCRSRRRWRKRSSPRSTTSSPASESSRTY